MRSNIIFVIIMVAALQVSGQGNVGIGTTTPSEKLDVNGNINLTGEIKLDGVAGNAGQMIQSSGNGSMEWTDVSALNGGVGYGTWGDCEMAGLSEYFPFGDPEGEQIDYFGHRVSISWIFAVAGAPTDAGSAGADEGSATVLRKDWNTGQWVRDGENKLYNPGSAAGDMFGFSVSIDSFHLVIGAPRDDESAGTNQGTISIYWRNPGSGNWQLEGTKMVNIGASAEDKFGQCVDISGNHVIAGAPYDDWVGGTDHGSAVIFEQDPNTYAWWPDGDKIIDPDNAPGDLFGYAVSISGSYAIISSPGDDTPSFTSAGSVSIYKKDPSSGDWELQGSKIFSPSPGPGYLFGNSVCIDGDYAIVGAPYENYPGVSEAGAAYVLKRDEDTGGWEFFGDKLLNPEMGAYDHFGQAVSISGNYALVGAPENEFNTGCATLFVNVGSSFQGMEQITDPWGGASNSFGISLGIDASTQRFIIGASGAFNTRGKVVFGKF